jgi:sister chromatid cohesion protein DCC1
MKHDAAPVEELITALADDHEVPRAVSGQVIAWFGDIKDGKCCMNINAIMQEIGLGILRDYRVGIHFPLLLQCLSKFRIA